MSFATILGQMLMLLLMMVLGYLARRRGLLDEHVNASLSKVVLNVTLPAQILTSFAMEGAELTNSEVGAAFGLSCLLYVFYIALAMLFVRLFRLPRQDWGTYQYMIIFGNIGFMGFPVITAIFGAKALVYAVIMNIVFNLLVFSYGIKLITDGAADGGGKSFSWRKLINMPLISSALTLVLFFLHIRLPEVINNALYTMGDATTPMAMLILGCTIAEMPLRELFDERRIYIFTACKLLAMPLLVFALLHLLPVANSLLGQVLVVLSAVPVATNATMLSIEYGGNNKLVAKGIFFSTVISVLTIPLLVYILY